VIPVYRTEDNRLRLMAIYDEKLRQWPVPFDVFSVSTRTPAITLAASYASISPIWERVRRRPSSNGVGCHPSSR
jgi:hypothetical protein